MKFKINRDHFASGLAQVLNVVSARPSMPILSNVLIEAADGQISLTTTNLDLGIRCRIKADVQQPGGITLPVRRLATIVRELPSLDVEVESTPSHQAKIASGHSLFRIAGLANDEFPALTTFSNQHAYVLPQEALARMLRSVSYAQSGDESRYIMNGVFFNFEGPRLTLAATDGRRLAVVSHELPTAEGEGGHLILPAKTVGELERLLNQGDTVRIGFNDRQVAFEIAAQSDADATGLADSVYLVSKVVEGNYPNYKQVIPRETDQHLKINRESFLTGVRRAALVASDKNQSVKLRMTKDTLEITSSAPEVGEAREQLAVAYDGPEVQVAFNPGFLTDPLKALTRDEIIFEFKDEMSPGVFRTPDSFLCVIMPLRLN